MRRFLFGVLGVLLIINAYFIVTTRNEKEAEKYIKKHGFEITAYKGKVAEYKLEKNTILGGDGGNVAQTWKLQQIWGVQDVDPGNYFNKQINIYRFTVKGHPLEKLENLIETDVNVMISKGKVIGGYCIEDWKTYSFDGKSVEDGTGVATAAILKGWKDKYGK